MQQFRPYQAQNSLFKNGRLEHEDSGIWRGRARLQPREKLLPRREGRHAAFARGNWAEEIQKRTACASRTNFCRVYRSAADLKKITIGQIPGASANEPLIRQIFDGTKYKVVYEPNMEDYLLCPQPSSCPPPSRATRRTATSKSSRGTPPTLTGCSTPTSRATAPSGAPDTKFCRSQTRTFAGTAYRKTCLRFFKLICATSLGKICVSDHAMNAVDEMSALNRGLKTFFDAHGADYPVWRELEAESGKYLK